MKRILWVSHHSPLDGQKKELEEAFNDEIDITIISTKVDTAYQIREYLDYYQCEQLVAVLPEKILRKLTEIGIKPIVANMRMETMDDGRRIFKHQGFEVIDKITKISYPLKQIRG